MPPGSWACDFLQTYDIFSSDSSRLVLWRGAQDFLVAGCYRQVVQSDAQDAPSTGAEEHPVGRLPEEWVALLAARGLPRYRAEQVFRWIHARGVMLTEQMSNLPKSLRAELDDDGLTAPLRIGHARRSADGSCKLQLLTNDDFAIETVLLPAAATDSESVLGLASEEDTQADGNIRVTQCISSQVGCALGCVFCASGVNGLERQMSAAEIVAQVLLGRSELSARETLRQVVFMGMGEPLANYDATARAIRLLAHPQGLALPLRRMTVSTAGLPEQIRRLAADFNGEVGLAVSIHQADDRKRSLLMPINSRFGLAELCEALRAYPLRRGAHLTIEYTLIRDCNASLEDAQALAKLLRGLRVKVNLIPLNPVEHADLEAPAHQQVLAFQDVLRRRGLLCFVRRRRGDDVAAACGQLALKLSAQQG